MSIPLDRVRARLSSHAPRAIDGDPARRAAVATVLRQGPETGETEVLLIRRAEHPADPWSGHMAFPGGRHEPGDPTLLDTALRETAEEVGLSLDPEADLLGRLDDLEAVARGRRTGLVIAPFVFHTAVPEPRLRPDPVEVAETVWAPLAPMARGDNATVYGYRWEGRELQLPAYDVEGRVVWGLTYQMLQSLFGLLG